MCYWGVEPANLPECYEPLVRYIREMAPAARRITRETAEFKAASGTPAPGWTSRTAQNIFGGPGVQVEQARFRLVCPASVGTLPFYCWTGIT